MSDQKGVLQAEVSNLQEALAGERELVREMWKLNCLQLSEFDAARTEKDEKLKKLGEQLACLHPHVLSYSHSPSLLLQCLTRKIVILKKILELTLQVQLSLT